VTFHYTGTTTAAADGLRNTAALADGQESGPKTNNSASPAPPDAPAPGIELRKSVARTTDPDGNGRLSAGDAITYALEVRNTGTTQVTGVSVTDAMLGAVTCPATTLAPGASTTCTAAAHKVTAGEVAAKAVTNTASVTATPPSLVGGGAAVTAEGTSTIPITDAAITLTKTHTAVVDANGSGRTDAGDTVTFSLSVTNAGTTPLRNVVASDPLLGATDLSCVPGTLDPGESNTCQVQPKPYTLTQADIDAGTVVNTATATGAPSDGGTAPTSTAVDTVNLGTLATGLTLVKSSGGIADIDGNNGAEGLADAGDQITYTFDLTNTGATTLVAPTVTDPTIQAEAFRCGDGLLAPGATTTCSRNYIVSQADINAGGVTNTATAAATSATATGPVVTSSESTVTTPITVLAALTLDKIGPATLADAKAGTIVDYTFKVTNTGTASVKDVALTDTRLTAAERSTLASCATDTLDPGKTTSCTARHALTQAEVDAGSLTNEATVTGTKGNGPVSAPVSASDSFTTTLTSTPAFTVTGGLQGPVTGTDGLNAGDTLPMTVTVTNTGATTLTDIRVTDTRLGLDKALCAAGPLAPGVTVTCTLPPYVLTQADIDRGSVTATSTVAAMPPSGAAITQPLPSSQTFAPALPTLTMTKQAQTPTDSNGNGRADIGEEIRYTFSVTNTGPVTLATASITDAKIDDGRAFTCASNLAPGAPATCTATGGYTLTSADIEAGTVVNSATAVGTDALARASVTANATDTVTLVVENSLTLVKASTGPTDANTNGRADAGETVPYTFTVTNTGQQTLTGVTITAAPCVGSLAPGARSPTPSRSPTPVPRA